MKKSFPDSLTGTLFFLASCCVISLIVVAFFLFLSSLAQSCSSVTNSKIYGYFRYLDVYKDGKVWGVKITGLTEEGRKQEVLIFPKTIKDKDVVKIEPEWVRPRNSSASFETWRNLALQKIFLYDDYETESDIYAYCPNIKYIIILNHEIDESLNSGLFAACNNNRFCYIPAEVFYNSLELSIAIRPANISFMYNYQDSPNYGYYWIDVVPYGEKVETVPEPPVRDGYRFGGWYKEPECINQWIFETDTAPQALLDEEGNIVFQEKRLYAKWIKN